MKIEAAGLGREAAYKLLTGIVVPRPIAWVTTQSQEGVVNLAPFSAFTLVSSDPPMVGMAISRKNGVLKDTARNIYDSKEFVVNIVEHTMAEQVHLSGIEYGPETSEVAELGLDLTLCEHVGIPRLSIARASLECRYSKSVNFGRGDTEFIVGEVIAFHVLDHLYSDGKIDTEKLQPICRTAGPSYGALGHITTLAPTFRSGHKKTG